MVPKENLKDLKRSHLFEELRQEHIEGLGEGLGEERKAIKDAIYNKLVATGGIWNPTQLRTL